MVGRTCTFALLFAVLVAPLAHAATATVTAIHATETGGSAKSYDSVSQRFRDPLASLPYDHFESESEKKVALVPGEDASVEVNARYTIRFTDTETEPDGHLKSTVRVFGVPRNAHRSVEVLEMTVRLAPNKPVMIRGLRMEEGEVVVFLNLD